jgi:hypothetical protein
MIPGHSTDLDLSKSPSPQNPWLKLLLREIRVKTLLDFWRRLVRTDKKSSATPARPKRPTPARPKRPTPVRPKDQAEVAPGTSHWPATSE